VSYVGPRKKLESPAAELGAGGDEGAERGGSSGDSGGRTGSYPAAASAGSGQIGGFSEDVAGGGSFGSCFASEPG